MLRSWVVRFILISIMVAVLARPATPPALACTPPPGGLPHHTVAERTNAADVVLEGTVIAVTDPDDYSAIQTATVHVQHYFKGQGPAIVTVANFGPTWLCLSPVSVDQRGIFYTTGDPETGLRAHYLSQFDAIDSVNPSTIAEVIATVGHAPVLPYGHYTYLPLTLHSSRRLATAHALAFTFHASRITGY